MDEAKKTDEQWRRELTPEQAAYLGIPQEGPFKPESYKY